MSKNEPRTDINSMEMFAEVEEILETCNQAHMQAYLMAIVCRIKKDSWLSDKNGKYLLNQFINNIWDKGKM